MPTGEYEQDPPLSEAQRRIAASLCADEIARIDAGLLAHVSESPKKVAMIVALAMGDPGISVAGLPDLYYAERVRHLIQRGALSATGNLHAMRHCEVCLAGVDRRGG